MDVACAIRRDVTPATAERIGAMLLAENKRSVNYRYNEDELESVYSHGADARAVKILRASAKMSRNQRLRTFSY